MKKIVSIFLSLIMILSAFVVSPLVAQAQEIIEDKEIQNFIDDTVDLIRENEKDKNITLYSLEETKSEFESCRLIVKSDNTPEKLNSVGIASGFLNYHIVQFSNEYDTEKAYEYYSKQKDIESVEIDKVSKAFDTISSTETEIALSDVPTRLNSWGSESTGLYELKDYVTNNNINVNDIVVGVIDSGVDLDHEFFKGRLIKTGFNSSGEDDLNSEEEGSFEHGTAVTSVIVDSTPDNVKIANYRIAGSSGEIFDSNSTAGLLQAIQDGVDVINMSFDTVGSYNSEMFLDAIKTAYEEKIVMITGAGNWGIDMCVSEIVYKDEYKVKNYLIVAAGNDKYSRGCTFSNYGEGIVTIAAPGEELPIAKQNNVYQEWAGTSFSSPLVASACAMMKAFDKSLSPYEIKEKLMETSIPFDKIYSIIDLNFGTGLLDAIDAVGLERLNDVNFSLEEGKYTGEVVVELSSEKSDEIYYTLDNTIPSRSNGIRYVEPIKFSGDMFTIKAVAYSDELLPSKPIENFYRSAVVDKDENFVIDDSGVITSYTGNIYDLIIPEIINGIEVTGIATGTFENSLVYGVTFPSTVTEISDYLFKDSVLTFIDAESVKTVGMRAFSNSKVSFVNLPEAEIIGEYAFSNTRTLRQITLPKVKEIGSYCFKSSYALKINLPSLTTCHTRAFESCFLLKDLILPSLVEPSPTIFDRYVFNDIGLKYSLDLENVEEIKRWTFSQAPHHTYFINRVEFSKINSLNSMPKSANKGQEISLVLPSTLVEINFDQDEERGVNEYKIYGTKGTYAEQWASENNYEFIEVTPENAVITDLPEYYKPYMRELRADVVGFNRTYQWYANTENNNTTGKPIEGATGKTFNPADYDYAPYYYCVVTSQDIGYEPITIRTSATENRSAHTHSYESVLTAPTCTGDGYTTYTCSMCCDTYIDDYVNALGHTDGEWEITIEPTYENDGEKTLCCAVCGDVIKTETIEKLPSKVTGVTLNKTIAEINYKDTFALLPEIMMNGNIEYTVTYSSSNEEVATVDENGNVVGVMRGNATITCTVADSNGNTFTNTCEVTVDFTIWQWILYIVFFGWIWM